MMSSQVSQMSQMSQVSNASDMLPTTNAIEHPRGRSRNWLIVILLAILGYLAIRDSDFVLSQGINPTELETQRIWDSDIKTRTRGSEIIQQPVYLSMTTIRPRLEKITDTIITILHGEVLPDAIHIYISSDPFLLDSGISQQDIESELVELHRIRNELYPNISITNTPNIGPHRKLLPLLKQHYNDDCVIVTVDDHESYHPWFLYSLLSAYVETNRTSVIAMRARRMALCPMSDSDWCIAPYISHNHGMWPEASARSHEMLLLPTGNGGILYRPQFFHDIVFDANFRKVTLTGDDIMFRFSTFLKNIPVYVAEHRHVVNGTVEEPFQYLRHEDWKESSSKEVSLASKFNTKGGNNAMISETIAFLNSQELLKSSEVISDLTMKERSHCLLPLSMYLLKLSSSHKVFHYLIFISVFFQHIYDKNCAIDNCN